MNARAISSVIVGVRPDCTQTRLGHRQSETARVRSVVLHAGQPNSTTISFALRIAQV